MDILPARQVHLDFHTGPTIPGVGADFNAADFARTLQLAHVNSITLFAKCHHGLLYYNSRRPERHPGLAAGFDLLAQQIDACKSMGIRTPIYLSVLCDEYAANLHPEWVCLNPDGTHVGRKPLAADVGSWQILDLDSPYEDFLADQIEEVVRLFKPVDGIFLDMCWNQVSVGNYAKKAMRDAGLDPANEEDRKNHAKAVVHRYMRRYNALIARTNGGVAPRVWYNARPKTELIDDAQFLQHIEIEALPTGGWGYTYFPLNVRWARNFGLPFIGMTARFHRSWSDFGGFKPAAALKYEVALMLAHGGGCSIGDQLHPCGTLDAEAYHRIGQAYAHVQSVEPWCSGAVPMTDVAVLRESTGQYHVAPGDTLEGVVRLLQQLAIQFNVLPTSADWSAYPLVIVPNNVTLTETLDRQLLEHLRGGKRVILAGPDTIKTASVELLSALGVAAVLPQPPGLKTVYFQYDRRQLPDAEQTPVVCYDGTLYLRPAAGAIVPATVVEPYFQRAWDHFCGHNQTPPAKLTAAVPATVGSGGAVIGFDLFKAFAEHAQEHVRRLAGFVLRHGLPRPLLRSQLPSHAELTVTRQPGRTIVHVLSYAPQRRTPNLDLVEESTPLLNRTLSVRLDSPCKTVTRVPAGETLPFTFTDGYATVTITSEAGHDLLVFEQ